MKILLLDNYDSFTYNLLHVVKELGYTDVYKRQVLKCILYHNKYVFFS